MTDTQPGGIFMLNGTPHVILARATASHVMTAPIRQRKANLHRADIAITMPGYGTARVACGTITRRATATLPAPVATLNESIVLALQVATRTEAETQQRENAHAAITLHTQRGMNETRHER